MWTAHPGGEQGDGERFLEPVARSASDRTIMRMYWKRCPSISLRTAAISGSTALAVRRTSDTTRPDARVRRRLWQARGGIKSGNIRIWISIATPVPALCRRLCLWRRLFAVGRAKIYGIMKTGPQDTRRGIQGEAGEAAGPTHQRLV